MTSRQRLSDSYRSGALPPPSEIDPLDYSQLHWMLQTNGHNWKPAPGFTVDDYLNLRLDFLKQNLTPDVTYTVEYSGSDDDGSVNLTNTNKEANPVPPHIEHSLEDLCMERLEASHPGWEINDGSQGECDITLSTDRKTLHIALRHDEFYSASRQSSRRWSF